jgi:hypothetical protein
VDRLFHPQRHLDPNNNNDKMPKKQSWISSEGRKLLDFDIRKKKVNRDMSLEQIYNMHCEEYEKCGANPQEAFRLFEGCLKSAFQQADKDTNRAAREFAALQQDGLTHPHPATNLHGSPQWEGSVAQGLMKQDVAAELHLGKTPTQFRLTRQEYQAWSVGEIGGHMKQEEKLQKWKKNYPGRMKSIPYNPL